MHHSGIIIKVRVARERTYYIFEIAAAISNDAPYTLAVTDPVTAVQCYRETWGSSKRQLARSLLDLGIPFNTYGPSPSPVPEPVVYKLRKLGEKPDGVWDHHDYTEYEQRVSTFLRLPHGRAALRRGGLVWRLAKEVLGRTGNDSALAGPSPQVCQFGRSVTFDASRETVWDDALSIDEFDLICGVYLVYSGKPFNKK